MFLTVVDITVAAGWEKERGKVIHSELHKETATKQGQEILIPQSYGW